MCYEPDQGAGRRVAELEASHRPGLYKIAVEVDEAHKDIGGPASDHARAAGRRTILAGFSALLLSDEDLAQMLLVRGYSQRRLR